MGTCTARIERNTGDSDGISKPAISTFSTVTARSHTRVGFRARINALANLPSTAAAIRSASGPDARK